MTDAACEATAYSPKPCNSPPKFEVVYLSRSDRTVVPDRHRACFLHALAEIDRHDASGGIALCEMREATP